MSRQVAIADVKVTAMNDLIANNLPYTANLSGGREVTFTQAIVSKTPGGAAMLSAQGEFRRNGVLQEFDWPWVLVNPPMDNKLRGANTAQAMLEVLDGVFV